jgi:NADPH:quinone reductase-like Zn-dependent oxidoreductase
LAPTKSSGRSRKALEQAADHGADAVVDLADEAVDAGLAAAAPGGYDIIIDFLWGGLAAYAMNRANVGARYVQVGNSAGATSTINAPAFRDRLLTLVGHTLSRTPTEIRPSAYGQLVRHTIDGKLTVDLERTPLDDISETWEHLKERSPHKLVVHLRVWAACPAGAKVPQLGKWRDLCAAEVMTIR